MTNGIIGSALVFGLIARLIWYAFLRPVPVQTALGVICNKSYQPAEEYWQQPVGCRDGFLTLTRIPIAECYVFGIRVERRSAEVRIARNTVEAQDSTSAKECR